MFNRRSVVLLVVVALSLPMYGASKRRAAIINPAIDMPGYLDTAGKAAVHREDRRVTEDEFIRMSREPGTIVLDARSSEKFAELHIRGAVNLSFPDITIDSLAKTIPDKSTRVLIYCNNNFKNAEEAFPGKAARASLNISTYIALYGYGYRNVYELGPLLDIRTSKLDFEGTGRNAAFQAAVSPASSRPR